MTEDAVAAHPIVAALASAMQRDGSTLSFPRRAIAEAEAALRAAPDEAVSVHLIALGMKAIRLAGAEAAHAILLDLTVLVAISLGSTRAATDRFADAGLPPETAAALGGAVALRAPQVQQPATAAVKARRGLQKP